MKNPKLAIPATVVIVLVIGGLLSYLENQYLPEQYKIILPIATMILAMVGCWIAGAVLRKRKKQ